MAEKPGPRACCGVKGNKRIKLFQLLGEYCVGKNQTGPGKKELGLGHLFGSYFYTYYRTGYFRL